MRIDPLARIKKARIRLGARNFRMVATLYGASFVFAGMFIIPAVLTVSSSPGFCATCHSMTPEYETWKRSSHAKITCYSCHGPKSVVQLIYNKSIVDSKGPLQEVTGRFAKPVNAESELSQEGIPMERCERCHSNQNRKFTFSRGIYMDHLAHKAAGIDCTVCHNRITHKGAENYEPLKSEWPEAKGFKYENFLTMKEGCFRCHSASPNSRNPETMHKIKNGKQPPQACTTCHTQDFPLPTGHGTSTWRSQHGPVALGNIKYCMSCHAENAEFSNGKQPWCTLCHDRRRVEAIIGRTWSHEK